LGFAFHPYGVGVGELHRSDRYTIEALGFALVAIGALLFLISLSTPTATPILLVVIGVILLILARDMKPMQERDAAIAPAS